MAANSSFTKSLFVGLWNVLNFSRKLFFNVIFIGLLIIIIISIATSGDDEKDKVTLMVIVRSTNPNLDNALRQRMQTIQMFEKDLEFAVEKFHSGQAPYPPGFWLSGQTMTWSCASSPQSFRHQAQNPHGH